ncbi:MAG: lytic transglycosylase domain-containing protein [Acidimicrobiia bacterium]|nr:lytic transglycosylase domain-containing protein [Acidimicrobiia bacterium]
MAALGGIIPPTSLDAYWRAAALAAARAPGCGIDWALIAGVGAVESRHGTYRGGWPNPDGTVFPALIGIPLDGTRGTALIRDTDGGLYDGDPVYDRAVGPMQFIPGTWVRWAVDGNGDGIADPHNIYDATFAAALYLCSRAGGPITDPEATRRAVLGYNRSWHYVGLVLANAATYRALAPVTQPLEDETPDAADVAAVVPAPGDVTDAVRPGDGATSTTTPSGESTTTSTTRPDVPDEADPPREPG